MARTVQVSELEGAAARAVARAREGEVTVVTANGRPVASIGPVTPDFEVGDDDPAIHLPPAGSKPKGLRGIRIPGPPLSDTIIEDRG